VLDGVFTEASGGALAFHPAPAPTEVEVAAALAMTSPRVQRLLVRHGLEPWHWLLGGQRPRLGDDITGIEARDRATAAGWR